MQCDCGRCHVLIGSTGVICEKKKEKTRQNEGNQERKLRRVFGIFFDWIRLSLLHVVSGVDFIDFVLFLEAIGMREYYCMTDENRLEAVCTSRVREQLCFARD